jgi:hypothetical protein
MGSTTVPAGGREVAILAGLLGNGRKQLPREIARYILDLGFTDDEKARMHDLAVRDQKDELSADEKNELHAFGKAGDVLAILKSRARRTQGEKARQPTVS